MIKLTAAMLGLAFAATAAVAVGSELWQTDEAFFRLGVLGSEQIFVGRLIHRLPVDEHQARRAALAAVDQPLYGVPADVDSLEVGWLAHEWSDGRGHQFRRSDVGRQLDEMFGRRVLWGVRRTADLDGGVGIYSAFTPMDLDALSRADLQELRRWVAAPDTANGMVLALSGETRKREAAPGAWDKVAAVVAFLDGEIAARR